MIVIDYLKNAKCNDNQFSTYCDKCVCHFNPVKTKGGGAATTPQKCTTTWKLPTNLPKDCQKLDNENLKCSCDKDCENIVKAVGCNDSYTTYCKSNGSCHFHKK